MRVFNLSLLANTDVMPAMYTSPYLKGYCDHCKVYVYVCMCVRERERLEGVCQCCAYEDIKY